MTITDGTLTRADLLKAGAVGALGLTFAGPASARTVTIQGTTLNMLTWSDHYANDQLKAVNGRPRFRAGRRCSATTPTRT